MTSSGTYAFSPSLADLFFGAFSLIQIRREEVLTQHLVDATLQANLLLAKLSNRNPFQFALETQSVPLIKGTAAYNLAGRTVAIAMAVVRTVDTQGTPTDRPLGPFSDTEYASVPNKTQQAPPTTYWFQLASTPQITLWPTPDLTSTYTLIVTSFRQMQDANPALGQTSDFPYRFLDTFVLGLASKLALVYKPESHDRLKALFEESFKEASVQDEQNVDIHITPGLGGYYQ
jgi:hypothetical protein